MDKKIRKILEQPFWPEGITSKEFYFRTEDDCDGDLSQGIGVQFSPDGDAWVRTSGSCRYRMPMIGGGRSPRVRTALLILAIAIKMDNEESPIT